MNDEAESKPEKQIHPALFRSNGPRVITYMLGSLLAVSSISPDRHWAIYTVLFFGFIYPTLFFQVAIRMKNSRVIGLAAYWVDALLWSLAIIATHYSIVILLVAPPMSVISSILMLGVRLGLGSLVVMAIVLLTGLQFMTVELTERFFLAQGLFGWLLIMGFMFYIELLINRTTRNFVKARHQLQDKNRQIMVQTEQLASISEVAQLVNSTLDIDQVMKTIMERLNREFDFTLMAIMFLDKENEALYLDRLRGDVPEEMMEVLLADIVSTAMPLFEKNDNRFETEISEQTGEANLDRTKVSQAILNLLSNAAKFTSEGLVRLTAVRSTRDDSDWLVVSVSDSGIGMTEEQLERIFDPFSQADASTTREFGGTGLGLSISRKFCELMGGTLTAESRENDGSTFTMSIPVTCDV